MKTLIEKFYLENDKIKEAITIVALSDLHYMPKTKDEYTQSILTAVKKSSPKYIVLVGDYFCGYDKYDLKDSLSAEKVKELLKELSMIAPVIMSIGNHDISVEKEEQLRELFRNLKSDNIYPLDNESIEFDDINFFGFYPTKDSYDINELTDEKRNKIIEYYKKVKFYLTEGKMNVLLHHLPNNIVDNIIMQECPKLYEYDLIVSGHAHNGWFSPKQEEKLLNGHTPLLMKHLLKRANLNEKELFEKGELQSYGFCESKIGDTPFIRKYSRGMHDVNGTKLIISKGATSGAKLVVAMSLSKFTKGYSYATEINIKARTRK